MSEGRGRSGFGVFNSIRTQYSLATAFFLLVVLGVFYIGGRIVLVHLVRESEEQAAEIGSGISRLAYRNADSFRRRNAESLGPVERALSEGASPADVMRRESLSHVSLVLDFDDAGGFVAGASRREGGIEAVDRGALVPYADRIRDWIGGLSATNDASEAVGIMHVNGALHYVSLARSETGRGGYVVFGSLFDFDAFNAQVNESLGGLEVKVRSRGAGAAETVDAARRRAADPSARAAFGLAPMLSEALDFYSGGFWNIGGNPLEAVFAIRDIAGNAVTTITVSLPRTFSTIARTALGRLTVFIAMCGIVLILPVFWFQSRVLLNPLTRMTDEIRKLAENSEDRDCPRLEWKGCDEFALLAESVNQMLETISSRTGKLSQLKLRQRALIEGVPDALVVFDRAGRLASVTKQPDGALPLPGAVEGEEPDRGVFGGEGLDAFHAALARVFGSRTTETVRLKVQRPAGVPRSVPTRHFEMRLTRMDDSLALGIVRDVTKEVAEHKLRLAAEQRTMDTSKRESLTLLAAGIAHDVNNVLSVILNTAEAAWMDSVRDEVKAEMDVIRDAVKRGSAMTRELMAYAGETKISLVRASPAIVVGDIQVLAEHVVGPNVAISYRLEDGLPDVDVDLNQFWKVFFNIIKNSGEALGSRPGNIVLSAKAFEMTADAAEDFVSEHTLKPGRGVVFRISDDGPGIRPELLPRIFDPYVSSKSLGRGLGLATVRTIVEAHGGGLKVTSEPDQGTTFHIYLPESRLPKGGGDAADDEAAASGEMPRAVLVVDNDEAILKTTSMLLRSLRVTAYVARDRHESLGILRRHSPDIGAILLDADLGGIDTLRLLEAFRVASPTAVVIVSSGSSEEELRRMFAEQPFDRFLAKPYTVAELKAALTLRA